MLKVLISAGTKVEKVTGNIARVGKDGNVIKLNASALGLLGVGLGDFIIAGEDDSPKSVWFGGTKNKKVGDIFTSKLGVVGEKKDSGVYSQLQFSNAVIGAVMYAAGKTFKIDETETTEYNGVTLYKATVIEDDADVADETSEDTDETPVEVAVEDGVAVDAEPTTTSRRRGGE